MHIQYSPPMLVRPFLFAMHILYPHPHLAIPVHNTHIASLSALGYSHSQHIYGTPIHAWIFLLPECIQCPVCSNSYWYISIIGPHIVSPVINSELHSIFPSIFPIFPALLQLFFPLLPHLERHLLYLVPGPNARTVRCSGESHVIHTLVYKECN